MIKNADDNIPDLAGPHYYEVIRALHDQLNPKSYFEIGSLHGNTLNLSRCSTIAVDPRFIFKYQELISGIIDKPYALFVQKPSDQFFEDHDLTDLFKRKVDLAFLDGMHRCEFLLRDFINTERHTKKNSIIMLHDCLPVEAGMTARDPAQKTFVAPHRDNWWTGDVWRTALLLKRRRKDLKIAALDAHPTGLILITNLDPDSCILSETYSDMVAEMMSWNLETIGIKKLFAELQVESASKILENENLTSRFWL